MNDLADLLEEARKRGLRVANLFERPSFAGKGWRCSLSNKNDEKLKWLNGEGPTIEKAFQAALKSDSTKKRVADLDDIL